MRKTARSTVALAALACAGPLVAHHSISTVDITTPVWVKGTVVRYELGSPHTMIELDDNGARLSLLGAARLPTGDEERSLGAGETVLSLAAGGAYPLSEHASIYGAVGYSNATESGDDGVFLSAGAEGRVGGRMLIGMSADWSEARVSNAPERTQVTLYSAFDVTENARLAGYVLAGLSESAPDTGIGVRLILH